MRIYAIHHKVAVAMPLLKHPLNEYFSEFILNSLSNITFGIGSYNIYETANESKHLKHRSLYYWVISGLNESTLPHWNIQNQNTPRKVLRAEGDYFMSNNAYLAFCMKSTSIGREIITG